MLYWDLSLTMCTNKLGRVDHNNLVEAYIFSYSSGYKSNNFAVDMRRESSVSKSYITSTNFNIAVAVL